MGTTTNQWQWDPCTCKHEKEGNKTQAHKKHKQGTSTAKCKCKFTDPHKSRQPEVHVMKPQKRRANMQKPQTCPPKNKESWHDDTRGTCKGQAQQNASASSQTQTCHANLKYMWWNQRMKTNLQWIPEMQRCTTSKANVKTHKQQKEEHARRQKLNYKEDNAEASQRNRLRREKCCRGWEAHSAYWTALIHLRCRAKVKAECQVITLQQQPNLGPDRLTPLAIENSSNQQGPKTMQK